MSGETEETPSGFTVDTGKELTLRAIYELDRRVDQRFSDRNLRFDERHVDMIKLLDERYTNQTKLLDERFATQTKAVETSFAAAEKAVATALNTAEKAVNKAEQAAEKRFEAVNEFRQSLNDIVGKGISRAEADATFKAQDEKIRTLETRLDRTEGHGKGLSDSWGYLVGLLGIIGMILVLVL